MEDDVNMHRNEYGAKRFWRRRWVQWTMGAIAGALLVLGVVVTVAMRRAEPMLQALIVEKLEQRFHARVELDSFHVSVAKGLSAEGKGLRIWPPAEVAGVSVPGESSQGLPLISLADFRFRTPIHFKPGVPIHITTLTLDGLTIDVPPRPHVSKSAAGNETDDAQKPASTKANGANDRVRFVVDSVTCKDARLTIETSKPGKLPLEFAIARMDLSHVSADGAMDFVAELTNPRPKGTIATKGRFGPWVVEDPGESTVEGSYTFENADLGTFKGIGGTLNSTGTYKGALREMTVDGETDTPNFKLADFGTPMPLHTKFHARVDGMNGDTYLEPVEATLGQSHFTTAGKVVGEKAESGAGAHPGGHEIALTLNIERGRMEDFLRLTSHNGDALLTGTVKVKSTIEISPGKERVMKRLKLKGEFELEEAQFTSANLQKKIGDLSLRGEGNAKDVKRSDGANVQWAMQGDFEMSGGTISLPDLKYTVPGAEIDLAGKYGVEDESLAFTGEAKMQATVSQMVGGWKGMLLKPADRFFKKDGAGTAVPIHIDGTRKDPQFGVDLGKMKKTSPQTPGTAQ